MVRSTLLAFTASALLLAGCGASDDPGTPAPLPLGGGVAVEAATAPRAVEKTDGRLGGATTARPAGGVRELTRGGRPDVRPRASGGRRDGIGAGASCPDIATAPAPEAMPAIAVSTLCLLNGERADAGLPPLTANGTLAAAAAAYAGDLVAGSYFSHTGRDGSTIRTRLDAVGYLPPDGGWIIGENLAWGTGPLATPGSIMQAWMNSPGHRANILNPEYREIGIGVAIGNPVVANGAGATYATAFGAIDDLGDAAPAEPAQDRPVATKPRRGKRRTGHRKAAKAKKARIARRAGKGKRRGKARRGPLARIAI